MINLAEQFRVNHYDVKLFALYPLRKDVREPPAGLPWNYVSEKQPRNVLEVAKLFLNLVRILRRYRPSFVLTALPAANVLTAAAARVAGAGVSVITSHHSPASTYNKVLNRVDALTGSLRSVSAIVCVSDFVKSSLADKPRSYLKKAVTIRNALPPDIDAMLSGLRKIRPSNRGRKIVATGRLAYQKNYEVLLRAARHLNNAEVVIIGGGPDELELKTLASNLQVENHVRFLGHMTRPEALSILASGDVFVQPSRFEGHSLALIEAAKLGLPLVVSDVPVQIEGLTAADGSVCGLVVGLQDDLRLAEELQRLVDDPEYNRLWSAAADKLADEITFERVFDEYDNIIRR
jgi:glycosyltransferase involved in cell wall biosynthesis